MSKIKVLDDSYQDFEVPIVIDDVLSCSKPETINSDNFLNFLMLLTDGNYAWINDTNTIGLDGDLFDIAKYKKNQTEDGELAVNVECEHVSYQLNDSDYDLETFAQTGTPAAVFTAMLAGTSFTVGTVEFTDAVTYSIQEKKSRRAMVVQFAEYIGGELSFNGFEISILAHRGSATPKDLMSGQNITIISKEVDKRNRDALGNPTVAYECALVNPMDLDLGDAVILDYTKLDIDVSLRIVSIVKNPYNDEEVSFSISNTVPTVEDAAYQIATTTVTKEKVYNGCKIGPEYGFEAVLSDKMARSYFNSTGFKMQKGDGTGDNWADVLYFDPVEGKYKFTGDIILENGVLTWGGIEEYVAANGGGITEEDFTILANTWISTRKVYLSELTSLNEQNPILYLFTKSGTAQSGGFDTVTLDSNASATDDVYKNKTIKIIAGTGSGQRKVISGYVGATKIATVSTAWETSPDATSVYMIYGASLDMTAANEEGVGNELRLKLNIDRYIFQDENATTFYFPENDGDNRPTITKDGFQIGNRAIVGKLTGFGFYNNGFVADYDNGNKSFIWSKDGNGRITMLTDVATNEEITVTWNGVDL